MASSVIIPEPDNQDLSGPRSPSVGEAYREPVADLASREALVRRTASRNESLTKPEQIRSLMLSNGTRATSQHAIGDERSSKDSPPARHRASPIEPAPRLDTHGTSP
ncbi:hypothetical protein Acsp06_60450 [Actinomycetospora sp. NBRC 106375]|nr:hypothetical protein Acsp06_60450 [Actinomycetospora sp. NBRC 106375]